MLTLTKKQFELEEKVQVNDEQGNVIYEFTMQITPEEMKELKELIFDENDVKNGRKMAKLEKSENIDELEELEAKVLDNARNRQERLEQICFKEHREEFKQKSGEYKYLEMVEMMFDFFVKTFADQKASQINTMSSHLKKITNN